MIVLIGSVCDRCGSCYGLPAAVWPGRGLCEWCDLSVPVWMRVARLPEQGAA